MRNDTHIHVHIDMDQANNSNQEILDRLTSMEEQMSELSDAVTGLTESINAVVTRVDEDVAHLNDLLNQALATNVTDAAAIAALQADAAATVASISASTTALGAIDPLADFPVVPPVEPTV